MRQGILPALVTPFDGAGRFQETPFQALIERVFTAGVDGIYVCGSTGEGLLQSVEQRKRITECALRHTPRGKSVVVHTGAYLTADAVELTKHAADHGAHAASSLPPSGAFSFDEVRQYYETLTTAAPIPFLLYFFPAFSPAVARLEQVVELCSLPNVIGLKFTDHNLYSLALLRQRNMVVFNGYDEVLAAGLLMGASGGIGSFYNLIPELFVQVGQFAMAGQWEQARTVQARINELIELSVRYPVFPAVKAILRWSGLDCGSCLAPRRSLTPAEESNLRESLRRSSFAHLAG